MSNNNGTPIAPVIASGSVAVPASTSPSTSASSSSSASHGYGFSAAAAILAISESRLRYWSQIGFVGPSEREAGKQAYTFQDLAAVKAAKELVDRGFSTADIRKALDRVRAVLPDMDRPLEHLRVAFDGQELVLIDDGAAFALTGQRVFDFGLGELRARASGWGRTTPTPLTYGSASRGKGRVGGKGKSAAGAANGSQDGDDSAHGCFTKGLAHERSGQDEEAASAYRRALKLDPGLSAAQTNLGSIAHRRGDTAGARACFEAALALDPEQPEARYNLAHLLIQQGETELGAAELRRVLQLDPDFADAHFNLATALETLGGRRQAREHLLRYLELAPAGEATETEKWAVEARTRLQRLGA